ncbi:MAG: hypothetical protein Q8934_14280 [Bacillota bacterium]|nr:hypothetical protein [Bacillota bacterium]
MYYDEIPKLLEVGKEYSAEQLSFFINDHPDAAIITDRQENFFQSKSILKITKIQEGYLNTEENKGTTVKNKIYFATKVK